MNDVRKILIEIKESQSFEKLEPFKKSSVWKKMAFDERKLLAHLLVLQGSNQLDEGNYLVLESFKAASKISNDDPEILFQQGEIFSSHRQNFRCLMLAKDLITKAIEKNPHLVKGWILRAHILTDMGQFENDTLLYEEAHQNYQKAHSIIETSADPIDLGVFFWNWGYCLASMGLLTGEPHDYQLAVDKFLKSLDSGHQSTHLYLKLGLSYASLGSLLDKKECFLEALQYFDLAVQMDAFNKDGWFNRGCCLQFLLDYEFMEEIYEQAAMCFERAAEICPEQSQTWLHWGQLEATYAKIKQNSEKLEGSLKKLKRANELDPSDPMILNNLVEILLFLGSRYEQLELLYSAQEKIIESLEINRDDPSSWYLYGSCFNELGHYFQNEDYYLEALEKFQKGLSINEKHPLLWYGSGLAQFSLGEITGEKGHYEKSIRHCSKAIECTGEACSQFWNDWGVALLKLAELTEDPSHVENAVEKFEMALKNPSEKLDGEEIELEWAYNYGSAFDLLGQLTENPSYFEKSVQILAQVVNLDPEYSHARYHLAIALSHQAELQYEAELYQKAIEQFQLLFNHETEDELIHLDYAMALTNLGLLIQDINHPETSDRLFNEAETHFMHAAALGNTIAYYQLAGLYSITGLFDQTMHYLEKAKIYHSLPILEDLLHDEWFEAVRQTPAFRHFINELSGK